MKKHMFSLLILTGCLLVSCGDQGGGTPRAVLPANLEVAADQTGEFGQMVDLTATAEHTNYFRFDFGDGSSVVEEKTGMVSHTYSGTGTFTITVQAHSTVTDFISQTLEVSVTAPDPTQSGYESPESYEGYTLKWEDDFEGSTISDDWTFEIGDACPNNCGWGNNELEYYRRENARQENGYLYITARKEDFGGKSYTSSRMITKGKRSFTYGRVDIRAILPQGKGIWPALWMLGSNINEVGWPACGELDMMEMVGGNDGDKTVHGTIHWENDGSHASYGGSTMLSSGKFADEFHVFSIIWDAQKIVWLLDNVPFKEVDITPEDLEEFHRDFFIIFNVAVGGDWPGSPDGTTSFPQQMIVDYIRVFQEN